MQRKIYIPLLILAILICTASTTNAKLELDERWRQDLTPEQHEQAKEIIKEARPNIKKLRKDVKEKIKALQEFCYAESGDDQTLAKLGQELQEARDALRTELIALDEKLMQEVGVSIRAYRGRSSADLTKEYDKSLHRHTSSIPHHGEH